MQLTANGAWPIAFFGVRDKRASLAIISVLDGALALEVARLFREDRTACALLAPYLAWSGYATLLNAAVSDPGPADPPGSETAAAPGLPS